MFKNYFTVALRNFWRNKVFSLIHILGLSIGVSASIVIYLIARYELTFDKFEKDSERIYRIVMDVGFNGTVGHSPAVPAPLAPAVQQEVTGVEASVPVMQFQGDGTVKVTVISEHTDKPVVFKKQSDVIFTNDGYFELLPFQWIIGSPEASMKEPFSVVLTEGRAHRYFPTVPLDQVVGKQLQYNIEFTGTVTGIVKDLQETTDFTSVEFISVATIAKTALQNNFMMATWNDWMAYSKAYVKLNAGNDKAGVEKQLNQLLAKYNKDANKDANNTMAFRLQPLSDIHFNTDYAGFGQRTANKPTLYGLLAIAAFLLILGCINFTNLTTAQASQRAKEIGIRKTIGSSRKQLVSQFLIETYGITFMATVLSISITPLLLKAFADFIPAGVSPDWRNEPSVYIFLFIITVVVTFLSGLYPSLILSKLQPVRALKDLAFTGSTRSAGIRKTLTVTQFAIAQFFVIAAFMVSKQIHFSLNEELGYRKEAILNFELPRDTVADHRDKLLHQIRSIPEIQQVSTGFLPPATEGAAFGNMSYNDGKNEVKVNVQIRWGDPEYIELYDIGIVAGRNIRSGPGVDELLINESYARTLGFEKPEDVLQKEITMGGGQKVAIVGVMKDFHEHSFHGAIGPLAFRSSVTGNFFHLLLQPQQPGGKRWQSTIEEIQKAFHDIYPEADFNYRFFDDAIARFYSQEQNTSRLLTWATGLSILISCLGLLGLVMYTSETRAKEIGIRKILGASVSAIVAILSREFVQLVLIAFVIAAPLSWWAVDHWLQAFAYRTPITWWVFAISGLFLLIVAVFTLSIQTVRTAMENPVRSLRTE